MTKYEGPVKKLDASSEKVYCFLSDFNHFEALLPADKITGWQSTADTCRFSVPGIGEVGLRIIDLEPHKTIKYSADGKTPFNFFLWIQLVELSQEQCKVRLTLKADLNPMLKMVVGKHVNQFLELLTQAIVSHKY